MKVIEPKDFEAFSPLYKGERGHRLAEFVMRVLAIDRINQVYDNSGAYTGAEFTSRLLDDLGVNYVVGNAERLKMLAGRTVYHCVKPSLRRTRRDHVHRPDGTDTA